MLDKEKDIALILYLLENKQSELEVAQKHLDKVDNQLVLNRNKLYDYFHPDSLVSQYQTISTYLGDQHDVQLNKARMISEYINKTIEIEKLFIRCKELQTSKHSLQRKLESLNCNFNEKRKIILAKPTLVQPFKNILKSFIADEKFNLTKSQNYFYDELRATIQSPDSIRNSIQWKDLSNFFDTHDNELRAKKNNSISFLRKVNKKCKEILNIRNFIFQFYQKQNIFFNEMSLLLEECEMRIKEERHLDYQSLIKEQFKFLESAHNLTVENTIRIGINSFTSNQSYGVIWDIYNDNQAQVHP
jgi:hypothetical protein